MNTTTFGQSLKEAFAELKKHVIGWDRVLDQAMYALATREHILWVSEKGRAKSSTARMIFRLFPDAKKLSLAVSKDMMPNAILGSEIPKEYIDHGKEIFNLDGGICAVDFAFLDEFFDAPDFLLRALNTVIHERVFERKDQQVNNIPLLTAIMTTNFNRKNDALEAVRDRIMCKAVAPTVTSLVDRMQMYGTYLNYQGKVPPLPQLKVNDLREFVDQVESPTGIKVSEAMSLLHAILVSQFAKSRIEAAKAKVMAGNPQMIIPGNDVLGVDEITPRTECKLHDFSRASALLDGRIEVGPSDMRALGYGIITIGGNSGEEELWDNICNDFLPNDRQLGRLIKLAEIAGQLAGLKKLGNSAGDIILRVGGKMETYTKTAFQQFLDNMSNGGGKAVQVAADEIKKEIASLGISAAAAA